MSDKPRLQWLRWWWPVCLWAALTASFSTESFSSEHTSSILIPFLHRLFPGVPVETLALVHYLVRKSAHVLEYFIFSLLVVRAIQGARRGWRIEWGIAAVVASAGWAGLDELHQAFVPSRGASMIDVGIDTCGAIAAQALLAAAEWLRARRAGADSTLDTRARGV